MKLNIEILTAPKHVVNIRNRDDCEKFLNLVHDEGYKWNTGKSYNTHYNYGDYGSNTCYEISCGCFANINYYRDEGYNILDIDDVIIKDKEKEYLEIEEPVNPIKPINSNKGFTLGLGVGVVLGAIVSAIIVKNT